MLARNHKPEKTIPRTAQIVDEWWMNAGREQAAPEHGRLVSMAGVPRHDGAGTAVHRQPGLAHRKLHVLGVEPKTTAHLRVRALNFQGGERAGGERRRQRRVPDKKPAPLDDFLADAGRAKDGTTVNAESFAQRNRLDEPLRRHAEVFSSATSGPAEGAGAVGIVHEKPGAGREEAEIIWQRRDLSAVRKEPVGEQKNPGGRA